MSGLSSALPPGYSRRRCDRPAPTTRASSSAAPAMLLLLLIGMLGALPASHAGTQTCDGDPFAYDYRLITYSNPNEGGRNYTLFDVYTASGCFNDWFTAKKICESKGLEMAPQGEVESLAALRILCAGNRYTCWMDGQLSPGVCYLMSQEGYVLQQGCYQPVRFVCRENRTEPGVLYLSQGGYNYATYSMRLVN